MTEGKGDVWVAAGFAELAHSGVDGVRVEVLAKNLGVTKGGFYRRFKDRAALLEAMLTRWRDGRVAAIEKQGLRDAQLHQLAAMLHDAGPLHRDARAADDVDPN